VAGLTHPEDLDAWHRWQRTRQPLTRRVRGTADRVLCRGGAQDAVLSTLGDGPPGVVVALDADTPTALGALVRPLDHLRDHGIAVVSRRPLPGLAGSGWSTRTGALGELVDDAVGPGAVVLGLGHFLAVGHAARVAAVRCGGSFVTVQHGLLTPHAPPLAPGTTLLAWTEADGGFWRSGRDDVDVRVVGSQLLWDAADHPAEPPAPDAVPVFLGQLHAAELPREVVTEAAHRFCLETGAAYRPHPAEVDRRSRATHRRWEAEGITVDRGGVPLRELGRPVVSVFSTGVLEAAAAGLPAWVHLPDPPPWVREFWTRYRLSSWGGPPTASPERPTVEPSVAVAEAVRGMMSA
jgi:hypothetical protein